MGYFKPRFLLLNLISLSSLIFLANAVPSTRSNLHIVHRNLRSDLLQFCKRTTNPNLCAQTIRPHFLHSALDPLKALEIEVDATLVQSRKIASLIAGLLAKHDLSKALRGSLGTCKSQYSSILDSISETKAAIAQRDIVTAKFKFSAVLSFQATCKDEFQGLKFPFAQDSDAVFQLGGNCLDIIANMEKSVVPKIPVQTTPSAFSNVIGTVS